MSKIDFLSYEWSDRRKFPDPIPGVQELHPTASRDHDPLAVYRAACENATVRQDIVPITKITAVGAACINGKISENDHNFIRISIKECLKAGIPIDPNFVLTVMNACDDSRGDFTLDPVATDLLIICNIPIFDLTLYHETEEDIEADRFGYSATSVSNPNSSRQDEWYKAAAQSQARVITAFGQYDEITTRFFCPKLGADSQHYKKTKPKNSLLGLKLYVPPSTKYNAMPNCIYKNWHLKTFRGGEMQFKPMTSLLRKDLVDQLSRLGKTDTQPSA